MLRECNFDSLVGPTHHYGGLSLGNLASTGHRGAPANPRAAALQGLEKMRLVASLGVIQAVLPPQPRPDLHTLRQLGFAGSETQVLERALHTAPELLSLCGSASAMWAANAATVAPSTDTVDGRLHLTPANLVSMFHRSLEASQTTRTLRAIFADERHFVVHDPLPASELFADEGAANHTRLAAGDRTVHLFGWGRSPNVALQPTQFPARQTLKASQAVARLHELTAATVFWQQAPDGIDAGSFHSDVLAVGNGAFLLLHELAFVEQPRLLAKLADLLGPSFASCVATQTELPVADAVSAYPFNSQLLTLAGGEMVLVAPTESQENENARRFLARVVAEPNPVREVIYVDVKASMKNGGGPACLRLRVLLTEAERTAIQARIWLDDSLHGELKGWILRHYRDRLTVEDLADPLFVGEVRAALHELYGLLRLGPARPELA